MLVVEVEKLEVCILKVLQAEALTRPADKLLILTIYLEALSFPVAADLYCFLLLVHFCTIYFADKLG